jgi:molecular chaperone DnaK (HSP70)
VASSVIQYLNSENGKRKYQIGHLAYSYLFWPEYVGTVFDQVKRKLGVDKKWTVHFTNDKSKQEELTGREMAADILRELLKYSERELKARPVRCAISHPSRFSQRQLDDLRGALREAFKPSEIPDENIKFYHEPIAAAVDYLVTQSKPATEESEYHLLVYDFGGGTTDFALIHVQGTIHPKRGRIIKPEVLRADGDPALGGEDLTDEMTSLYGEKIELRAQSLYPKVAPENLRFPLDVNAESDLFLQKIAQENRVRLRQWTEERKLQLAKIMIEGKEEAINNALPRQLTLIVNGSPVRKEMGGEIIEFTTAEFNEMLSRKIEPSLEKLAQLPGKAGITADQISLVLLSGQSSALPLVKEKIQSRFRNAKVERLNKLKECVVRGLCALQSDELSSGPIVRVVTQGCLSTTTSRLGFRVTESWGHRFKQVVGVGHPIDKDGYSCEVQRVNYKRNTALPLYEHMGPETDDSFSETDPRIRVVKVFRISDKLAEMGEAGKRITDDMLFDSELWFTVKPNQQVELEIRFKQEDNLPPIRFEATYAGY